MKPRLTLVLFILSFAFCFAQQGEAYKSSRQVHEKEYRISLKYGRPKMTLEYDKTGYYDADGFLLQKRIRKANQSHHGFIIYHRDLEKKLCEELEYNAMNQLHKRTLEQYSDNPLEKSRMCYDNTGKLISKELGFLHQESDDFWLLKYAQLGHIESYKQGLLDEKLNVKEGFVYDLYDELKEKQSYTYDEEGRLVSIIAQNDKDEYLYRKIYTYNDKGLLEVEEQFSIHELPDLRITNSYDEKGRLLQRSEYEYNPRFGGSLEQTKQWDYSYK